MERIQEEHKTKFGSFLLLRKPHSFKWETMKLTIRMEINLGYQHFAMYSRLTKCKW